METSKRSEYYSQTGYRMTGGNVRPPASRPPFAWVSFGIVVGGAILVTTYFAIFA